MDSLKKAVFTDEKRVAQRTAGFKFATKESNMRKEALSEFM